MFAAGKFTADVAWLLGGGRAFEFRSRQLVVIFQPLHERRGVRFTKLRHAGAQIRPRGGSVDEYFAQPAAFQFRADSSQRRWKASLIAQILVDSDKENISVGRH